MNNQARVTQYLERYVLNDSRAAAELVARHGKQHYERVLCVPMFDESTQFLDTLKSHPAIEGTLIILVVNAPDSADTPALERTRDLLAALENQGPSSAAAGHAKLYDLPVNGGEASVLVMNHCSEGRCLPQKEGVGLARKLGNDVALELWQRRQVASPWLFQTDADATLPDNYFTTPKDLSHCAAIHLNFEHRRRGSLSRETSLAQRLYDLKLDYYVTGLTYAGSPFAHYSVGSACVIHAGFYAIVRGYPRHSAGEDFYLLNKLSKEGHIAFDPTRTVLLTERKSGRVPFGTGPGVAKFDALESPLSAAVFYAPDCFIALKSWLEFLKHSGQSAAGQQRFRSRDALAEFIGSDQRLSTLCAALRHLDLFSWLQRTLRKNGNPVQACRQLTTGMDALKTLRLIHALRDHGFANVDALTALEWLNSQPPDPQRLRRNVDGRLTDV